MTEFDNGLTKAQSERLALLLEEMGEAIQMIGKIQRHGLDSFDPTKLNTPTNRKALSLELGHVLYAILLLSAQRDVFPSEIDKSATAKAKSIRMWLHHQDDAVLERLLQKAITLEGLFLNLTPGGVEMKIC